jgi:PPOX class probable F420-dependent enzyme
VSRTRDLAPHDWKAFVLGAPRTGKLATVRADGRPTVVPVWVAVDGDDVVFNAGDSTAKVKAIRREPPVCICFDDERPPFAFVTIEATATLSGDLDEVRHWATVIGGRYMGEDRAEEFGTRNGVPGELLVRVTPTRVIGETAVSD